MAKAFASQSLIGCQLSRHGGLAGIVQPKQWRASMASPAPKPLFSEENRSKLIGWSLAGTLALGLSLAGPDFADAKIGVNKPTLLPKEFSPVIDVAGFLSPGQGSMHGDVLDKIYRSQASVLEEKLLEYEMKNELSILAKSKSFKLDNHMTVFKVALGLLERGFVGFHRGVQYKCAVFEERRLVQKIEELEKNTGYKLRILAQNYPDTPGTAVKDFWHVDGKTIVFVVDPTFGNILHFNVGELIDNIPHNFWSRVAGKYGNMFYWKEKGEDAAIEAAVAAISNCLIEPNSTNCSEIQL